MRAPISAGANARDRQCALAYLSDSTLMFNALRPYGNEIILMIKGSAIVAIITVYDLMGQARWVFSKTFDFQAYLWAAVIYLIIVETLRFCWDRLEGRLTRHLKR